MLRQVTARRRSVVEALLVDVMSLPLTGLPVSAAAPPEPSPYALKTDSAVSEQLDAGDRGALWVQPAEQADMSAARSKNSRTSTSPWRRAAPTGR
ncbi:hypothetical protein [Streptomyces sp. NPDC059651]|uniref:hypothetical protein n=1 Tax=Streptomyces sp. NPDC059651 TaxID=3346897 RepID=UPI0036C71B62